MTAVAKFFEYDNTNILQVPLKLTPNTAREPMDLHEQRITCLRMALEMGCKADSVVVVASELMSFLTTGVAPSAAKLPVEEKSESAIAACGTALAASEAADLVQTEAIRADAPPPTEVVEVTPPAATASDPPPATNEVPAAEPTLAASVAEAEPIAEPAPAPTVTSDAPMVAQPSAEAAPTPEPILADASSPAKEAAAPDEEQAVVPPTEVAAMTNGAAKAVPTAT